ncbi:hypothetical protein [Streptomyces naphthomycinicus]|uniref:hypothetical protein n=1 Tax=Streptomyces naphthomycinicus TaxID=2872625 RepID=UPI001CECB1D2|nr:hypothetical protein [Streptomyces sp. TML10]
MTPPEREDVPMLAIVAAALFFIAFLIDAADISTNDVFTQTNIMLIGLALVALHLAGLGSGRTVRGRRR